MKKSLAFWLMLSLMTISLSVLNLSCSSKTETKDQPAQETPASKEEISYACPMHPEVTGKEGDTCSTCGMKLEKVSDEEDHDHQHDDSHN